MWPLPATATAAALPETPPGSDTVVSSCSIRLIAQCQSWKWRRQQQQQSSPARGPPHQRSKKRVDRAGEQTSFSGQTFSALDYEEVAIKVSATVRQK